MQRFVIAAYYTLLVLAGVWLIGGLAFFISGIHQMSPDNLSPWQVWLGLGLICCLPLIGMSMGIISHLMAGEDEDEEATC